MCRYALLLCSMCMPHVLVYAPLNKKMIGEFQFLFFVCFSLRFFLILRSPSKNQFSFQFFGYEFLLSLHFVVCLATSRLWFRTIRMHNVKLMPVYYTTISHQHHGIIVVYFLHCLYDSSIEQRNFNWFECSVFTVHDHSWNQSENLLKFHAFRAENISWSWCVLLKSRNVFMWHITTTSHVYWNVCQIWKKLARTRMHRIFVFHMYSYSLYAEPLITYTTSIYPCVYGTHIIAEIWINVTRR